VRVHRGRPSVPDPAAPVKRCRVATQLLTPTCICSCMQRLVDPLNDAAMKRTITTSPRISVFSSHTLGCNPLSMIRYGTRRTECYMNKS
jgi:hypothetical protein